RPHQTVAAEADIGDPRFVNYLYRKQHVRARRGYVVAHAHPGGQRRDLEAERPQRVQEQVVLLEAVAAPAVVDQLALDAPDVQPDRLPQLDVQVLERDRGDVRHVDLAQRRQRRLPRTV